MWRAPSSAASVLLLASSALAADAELRWRSVPAQSAEWHRSPEAWAVGEVVLRFQHPSGGWSKNVDWTQPIESKTAPALTRDGNVETSATIDNGATVSELRFLAKLAAARADERCRAAFLRGLDYLFAAQYDSGGWPQFFPLRPGYYGHVTYNDDAMIGVLTLLREVADGAVPFVDGERRERARAAVAKGQDCILRSQVVVDGKRTVWCAQHDEKTLAPAWARTYEPPSLSGNESVGIVRFLMTAGASDDVAGAIVDAVAWLQSAPLHSVRVETTLRSDGSRDRRLVTDDAAPPLWARFYEIGSNRPIFMGRDSVARAYNEIELERRLGYAYFGVWPATLLQKEYPEWLAARTAQPPER